jgi:hypothetical protein
MQKRFFFALAVLLSSLPASAQTRSVQLSLMQQSPAARISPLPAASSGLPPTALAQARPPVERTLRFTAPFGAAYNPNPSLERLSPVEVLSTPFIEQLHLTVVPLYGGRLQLGGIASTTRIQNVLMGVFDSQGHPGARYLRAHTTYGFSLTFHWGGAAHADRRAQ